MSTKVYDPELTIKIVNVKMNYDFENNYFIRGSWYSETGVWRKNGYLAYGTYGEELGVVFEDDKEKNPYYKCANILFFKSYKDNHNVGIWRIIRPTDCRFTNVNGYIPYKNLENELSKNGFLKVTTKSTFHSE